MGNKNVPLCTEDEGTLCIGVVAGLAGSRLELAFRKLTASRGEGAERKLVFCFLSMMFVRDQGT